MPTIANVVTQLTTLKKRVLLDKEHYEIHEGHAFHADVRDEAMGSGDQIHLVFKTPDTGEIHMVVNASFKTAGYVQIYEDCTYSGGQTGTQVTILNRNRQSSAVSHLLDDYIAAGTFERSGMVMKGISGFGGTLIHDEYNFGEKFDAHLSIRGEEFILNTGTKYGVRAYADAATSACELHLEWYEEGQAW